MRDDVLENLSLSSIRELSVINSSALLVFSICHCSSMINGSMSYSVTLTKSLILIIPCVFASSMYSPSTLLGVTAIFSMDGNERTVTTTIDVRQLERKVRRVFSFGIFINMSQPIPIIRYTFDLWTSDVTITNEGLNSSMMLRCTIQRKLFR